MEMNIYAYKCKKCGYVQYPYRTICKNCKDNDYGEFVPVTMAKNGKLLTFTHLFSLPADFETTFLTLGIVELEDGNKITGQLNIKNPKIGMKIKGKVETVRRGLYEKRLGIVFYEMGA